MTNEKPQKWYNSKFSACVGEGIGIGAVILSLAFGIRNCKGPTRNDVEMKKARVRYVLQEKDLNNNGQIEKFYEINGQKYFSVIDGKNLEDWLK